jgi:hypothetical protein
MRIIHTPFYPKYESKAMTPPVKRKQEKIRR